jgi:hypothetical protein
MTPSGKAGSIEDIPLVSEPFITALTKDAAGVFACISPILSLVRNDSRLRRAEIGIHHHIAGAYLLRYAQESSWREDNRRVSNGDQVNQIAKLALKRGKSVDFTGYWQRHAQK